jgi:hypothetical protein|tara:strand:+ start:416 stop:901 length:486 start_codon:yes stop_codon:yes gene_type:complete
MIQQPSLDAPIPGEGLTHKLGDRPWQKPAQLTNVDEVMPFYREKILDEEFIPQLLQVIELGIPLTTIANAMQSAAVMEGVHSIDVGVLMLPIVVELLKFVAEKNNVKYVTGMEKREVAPNDEMITALAMKEIGEEKDMPEAPVEEEPVEEPQPRGLMARSM